MIYIEAPEELKECDRARSLFLSGGITSCPDWQFEMVTRLTSTNLVLLNPRRQNFPIGNLKAAEEQITWEHNALRLATEILFWFPKETICPIVLYELGSWSMSAKKIYVGVHPDYERRRDVEIQTRLVRPEVDIVNSIWELASQVRLHWDNRGSLSNSEALVD